MTASGEHVPGRSVVQVGWRSRLTGEMCDCAVHESSPHANSDPVMIDRDAFDRIRRTEYHLG